MNSSSSEFSQQKTSREEQQQQHNLIAKALVKLEVRMETVEIKIMGLTNVVRLLQQYTEKKDQQYQKETQNVQNLTAKLLKSDHLQSELHQASKRTEELFAHVHSYSLRIEQIGKAAQERQGSVNALEERLDYEVAQLAKKLSKIEGSLLQQMRESHKEQEPKGNNQAGNSYAIQELTFKLELFQNKFWSAHKKVKDKLQSVMQGQRMVGQQGEYQGTAEEKRKGSYKQSSKNKYNSAVKRLKSK